MMAKIYAPNKQYDGISASVKFTNGVGVTESPLLKEWFLTHGYMVEEEKNTNVDKMSKEELVNLAILLGIETNGKTKVQLLDEIKAIHKEQELEESDE